METLLERWGRFVAGAPLIVLAAWIVLVVAALHFGPSPQRVAERQQVAALPASAPSMRAARLDDTKFAVGAQNAHAETDVLVIEDSNGISQTDLTLARQLVSWLTDPATRPAHLSGVTAPAAGAPVAAFESADHRALRLPVRWDTDNATELQSSVDALDAHLARLQFPAGVTVGLDGSSAFNRDYFEMIFGSAGAGAGTLIGLLIILLVLGYVYRSPLAVMVPLITIGFGFALSVPVIAWLGQAFGLPVMTFSLQYVAFVLLGAGTNYGVFMLSRYREELRRDSASGRDARRVTLGRTVGRVGEAIASSAATVIVATGVMGLAQLNLLRVTGPAVAVGVACLLLAGLSLLPALMALYGRVLFWPATPRPGTLAATGAPTRGLWAAAGRLVTQRPLPVIAATLIVLVPLAVSALGIMPSFDFLRTIPASAPSVQAFHAYQRHFGDSAQLQVFVSTPGRDLRAPDYAATLSNLGAAFRTVPHVSAVAAPSTPARQSRPFALDGSAARFTLALDVDPDSQQAQAAVDGAYAAASQSLQGTNLSGSEVLIGGESAGIRDQAAQLGADFRLVLTLVCLAIYVILALLVRSLTAPLYLLGTIALSAGTAIGATNLIFHDLLGQPLFYIVPVFAFVFLVALGEDFNILTMSRIREEVRQLGHRKGIAAAVTLTGGVVSSCGLVMAASFARMASNPILEIAESGFAILLGVLVDTFVVRPLLVPAIATILGRWNWVWPGPRTADFARAVVAAKPLDS